MKFQGKLVLLLFYSLLLVSVFFSCKEIKNDNNNELTSVDFKEYDSLSHLIESSISTETPPQEKMLILAKALQQVKNFPEDSLKMNYLSKISYYSIQTKDSLFFRSINNETINLSEKIQDSSALAEAKWDLGIFFNDTNQKDSAYFYYSEAASIYAKLKKHEKVGRLLYSIGITQREIGDYSGAEVSTIKAIEIFKGLDDKKRLSKAYNSLGAITTSLGNHQQAINFYQTANGFLADDLKNNSIFSSEIVNNIGNSYRELGEFKKAEENFESVLATDSLKLKEPSFYAKTLTNLANSKLDLNTKEDLSPLFLEAISLQNKNNNLFSEATSTGYFANYLAYKKDTTNAISYAKEAIVLAENAENTQSLLRTLDLLTRIDKENATQYAQKYFAINNKLQQEERQLRDKFARVRFETFEVIERNQLLLNQNELLKREKQLWIALAGVGILGVLAILIIVVQRIKNKNLKFKQQQQEANQEIFNLLMSQEGKLAEGIRSEQDRISKELHDGVVADMLGIRLVLVSLNNKNDDESVAFRAQLLKDLENLSEEVRNVSHELNSAAHQKVYNFMESLKALIEKFKAGTNNIDYQFIYRQDFNWDTVDTDIKINLYRILQENIQNVIKHAKANSIFINFEVLENTIVATIEDDGVGFDTKKHKKGIGVKNITSRIKKLNGDWKLESTVGEGTKVTIKIPFENKTNRAA